VIERRGAVGELQTLLRELIGTALPRASNSLVEGRIAPDQSRQKP
jgi:hypothetical protein